MKSFHNGLQICLMFFCISLFIGCGVGAFKIIKVNDKFSDPKQPYGFQGQNNRLSSKSSQGGVHVDSKGVYVEPYVYRDRTTNEITSLGFHIAHYGFDLDAGFRPIQEIVFLTDKGDRVVLDVKSVDSDLSVGGYNSVSNEMNTSFSETGICMTTKEDFLKLATATTLEAKITGGKLSQTYDKSDISSTFIKNLKQFYDEQLK